MTPLDAARKLVKGWPTAPSMRGTVPAGVAVDVARAFLDLTDNCEMILASEVWRGDEDKPLPAWALHLRDVLNRLRTERSPDEPA